MPDHQFGFQRNRSTIDQLHRINNQIEKALEEGKVCSPVFLDIMQAFDKIWNQGLLHKLKKTLPGQYVLFLKSYLFDGSFRIRQEDIF